MRFLQLRNRDELILTKDLLIHHRPPYAILSHTWGGDDDEVTFQDIRDKSFQNRAGYQKILSCGGQAERDGFGHFWVDTCCIDKTNNTELAEAINSMFSWYQQAKKCYVYMVDVQGNDIAEVTCKTAFQRSRWFTRGWTLQELLAPESVEFFSSEWHYLGDKKLLEKHIFDITKIPVRALQGYPLSEFSIEERITWSNHRATSRVEDKAYSLLGILGIHMSLIYGEGEIGAFKRLRREVDADKDTITQNHMLDDGIFDQCIADLRISDPRDDKSRIESTKGGLIRNSYRWILDNKDFRQWRDGSDENSSLLWIRGDPGKGKTMLLCGIADELTSLSTNQCLVSFFFCQATDRALNNAIAVIRGLIYMLIRQDRLLANHLYEEWRFTGPKLFEDGNAWDALTRILTAMLQDCRSRKAVLIIDALDECSKDLSKLLNFVIHQSQNGGTKWLVSSRNWPEIGGFFNAASRKMRLSLELNADSIAAAVRVYICHKADEIRLTKRIDNTKCNEIIEYMTSNADNTFLWVALVYQRLTDPKIRARHISTELKRLPAGLDAIYQRMLEYIDASLDADLCREILGTLSVTYRPMSLVELTSLFQSDSLGDMTALMEVIQGCGSFLTIRDGMIYFVHQSAKDFLLAMSTNSIFPLGIHSKHISIARKSLKILDKSLRQDIYNINEPGFSIASTANIPRPSPDPLSQLRYCCIFWVDHTVAGLHSDNACQEDTFDLLYCFLQRKCLFWLEALCLIGALSAGTSSLSKLLQYTKDHTGRGKRLDDLTYDALRLLQYHGSVIMHYPLQAYASALVFSPEQSLVRSQFRPEKPELLALKPRMAERWNAHLQTLEGHTDWVSSVSFSYDGRRVVSGSHDLTVVIWDVESGDLQSTLDGHTDYVTSVAFSHDGRHVVSGSDDRTVRIWDVESGDLEQTLKGHTDWVSSVTFSHNDQHIVSGSYDQTVRIWNAESGQLQQTLHSNAGGVISVAVSHDGRSVVSGSHDNRVQIWDADSGDLKQVLYGHTSFLTSVMFSHDDRHVVSGSFDETVRIWDAESGEMQQILKGHTARVTSVAFSHDGRNVVSGSYDETLRIWNAKSGNLQQIIKGHTSSITSVAFSHEGTRVVSGSADQTVRIWDAESRDSENPIESHTDYVTSVALSHDGRFVASGSYDKSVRIWDAKSGECRQVLNGHTGYVYLVAFSHDNQSIVSGSSDNTVRIWKAESGCLQQTFNGHTNYVTSVAFSYDDKHVVSGSYDMTVRIWEAESGHLQQTLHGHMDYVRSVAFSPDNRCIASGSYDETIRIWDAESGDLQQTLVVGSSPEYIRFDSGGTQILTNAGTFTIKPVFDSTLRSSAALDHTSRKEFVKHESLISAQNSISYGISQDGCWITANGYNILWLPVEYRPLDLVVSDNTVVIGCRTGRVLIMRFK